VVLRIPVKIYMQDFLEGQESSEYKFQRKGNGDIFVVDMPKHEHKFVITLLIDYFKIPNGDMFYDSPIDVVGNHARKFS
ncbi:13327_t:CDS:1, partial [Entrophospora sp. SA101]